MLADQAGFALIEGKSRGALVGLLHIAEQQVTVGFGLDERFHPCLDIFLPVK
jgi:hypothetical protein